MDTKTKETSHQQPSISREQTYLQVSDSLTSRFLPMHNLLTQSLLEQKITCYNQLAHDPLAYYVCFDSIERTVIRDAQRLTSEQQHLDDQFTICRFGCREQGEGQKGRGEKEKDERQGERYEKACLGTCRDELGRGLMGVYQQYYQQRLESHPEYGRVKR